MDGDSTCRFPSQDKITFRLLLLVALIRRVCGKPVNPESALHYQAEENQNLTVEWRFSSGADVSVPSLKIHCVRTPELQVFFHLDVGVQESQHQQFAGRVQCDAGALGAGLVRLRLSGARPEDSGEYLCRMATGSGRKVTGFSLNVTAARDEPESPMPETQPQPSGRHRTFLYAALAALAAVVLLASLGRTSAYSALISA